nr:hypothetical protein [Tanacetum cinerariifolium]
MARGMVTGVSVFFIEHFLCCMDWFLRKTYKKSEIVRKAVKFLLSTQNSEVVGERASSLPTRGLNPVGAINSFGDKFATWKTLVWTYDVISLYLNEESSNIGLNGMKEVTKGYKKSSRVGFAHLLSGTDLYICPRSDPIITILAKYGFFKGMSVLDDKPDSMIGCVVWRKNRPSTPVGNTSDEQSSKKAKIFDDNDDDMPEWAPPELQSQLPPQITTPNFQTSPSCPPRSIPLPPPPPIPPPPRADTQSSFSYQPFRPAASLPPHTFTRLPPPPPSPSLLLPPPPPRPHFTSPVLDDKPDSMIGCVVWRKNRPSTPIGNTSDGKSSPNSVEPLDSPPGFSTKQSTEKELSPEKKLTPESSQREEPLTLPLTTVSAEVDHTVGNSSSSSSPLLNPVVSVPCNLARKRNFEDDDLPEFDFGVSCVQKSTLVTKPVNHKFDNSLLTHLPNIEQSSKKAKIF